MSKKTLHRPAREHIDSVNFDIIASVSSPFDEKFLIPRQPGLVPIKAKLVFYPPFNDLHAFEGLEGVSHLWLQFIFDGHKSHKSSSPLRVRPPRLGGNKKVGVFATRSSFRPNPLGLSLVKLLSIESNADSSEVCLWVEGLDCLNNSKVIDIKPFLPYADSPELSHNTLASAPPNCSALSVLWSEQAERDVQELEQQGFISDQPFWQSSNDFVRALSDLLALDPRPQYHKLDQYHERQYGVCFSGVDVQFCCSGDQLRVIACKQATASV